MIIFIILFFSILTLLVRRFISDKLSKIIISLYLIWWAFWLALSTLNLYNLFPVSMYTYFLLILNVIMVIFGFLYGNIFRKKNRIQIKSLDGNIKVLKSKLFLGLLAVLVIILLYFYQKYKANIISSPGIDIRMQRFQVGLLFTNTKELFLFNYFIESSIFAMYGILAYLIVYNYFKNLAFFMTVISLFLYAGIGSGRGPIIYLVTATFLVYFIRKYDLEENLHLKNRKLETKWNKKGKKRFVAFVVFIIPILFVYASWLTAVRLGLTEFNISSIQIGGNEVFKEFIIYYTGPFRALEYGLNNFVSNSDYLWGRGTFAGIDEIINSLSHLIGIDYRSANGIIGSKLQDIQISIGANQSFNFAYTSVMIHYFDLGIAGVIVFPFIYGIFVRNAIFLYQKAPTIPSLIIVVFLFQTMIFSVFNWGLQSPSSNIVLISSYIWHRWLLKKKKYDL